MHQFEYRDILIAPMVQDVRCHFWTTCNFIDPIDGMTYVLHGSDNTMTHQFICVRPRLLLSMPGWRYICVHAPGDPSSCNRCCNRHKIHTAHTPPLLCDLGIDNTPSIDTFHKTTSVTMMMIMTTMTKMITTRMKKTTITGCH